MRLRRPWMIYGYRLGGLEIESSTGSMKFFEMPEGRLMDRDGLGQATSKSESGRPAPRKSGAGTF